jgi:hypothetical protein
MSNRNSSFGESSERDWELASGPTLKRRFARVSPSHAALISALVRTSDMPVVRGRRFLENFAFPKATSGQTDHLKRSRFRNFSGVPSSALFRPRPIRIAVLCVGRGAIDVERTMCQHLPLRQEHTRRPQSGCEYPLNLSILLSGGKETNKDSPSSGERTGKSPAPNPAFGHGRREMWCLGGSVYPVVVRRVQVLLERGHLPREGARPVATVADCGRISPQSRVA